MKAEGSIMENARLPIAMAFASAMALALGVIGGSAAAQQTNAPNVRQQSGGTVQVGAGTTTEVTTGSSGPQQAAAAPAGGYGTSAQGAAEGASPQAPDASLCDRYQDATVRKNCMEKAVD